MRVIWSTLLALGCVFFFSSIFAEEPVYSKGREGLQKKYEEIKSSLNNSVFHIPIYLETDDGEQGSRGDVYGVLAYPFKIIAEELHNPIAWCDVIILHINIKMCEVEQQKGDESLVNVYVGKKHYQRPEDSEKMLYRYNVAHHTENYLQLNIKADKGPFGTSGYIIEAEFIPIDENSTLIHFAYVYHYGFAARMAIRAYLSTIGSGKVGFTITGYNDKNEPQYVRGMQGIIERNSMRYFLAILAYLDGLNVPLEKRFEQRSERWFEYTIQYHEQLYEFEKDEYMESKRQEWENQVKAQQKLSTALPEKNSASEEDDVSANK